MLAQLPRQNIRSPFCTCGMGNEKDSDRPQLDQPGHLGLIWLLERVGLFWSCVGLTDPGGNRQGLGLAGEVWGQGQWPCSCWLRDHQGWQSKDTSGRDNAIVWLSSFQEGHQWCTQPGWDARLPFLVTPLCPWNHCWQCWVEGTHGTCFAILSWSLQSSLVCGRQVPSSHTHDVIPFGWKVKRHCTGSAISWGPAVTSGLCVTPLLSVATQDARGSMERPGKIG